MAPMSALISMLLFLVLYSATVVYANPVMTTDAVATEFIILHNNDMHARFEQTSALSGKCTAEDANANKCYGGFARVAHEVRKFRKEAKNGGLPVFYLNAGDNYMGTSWFSFFKYNITADFLNELNPDAMSLGNHEFDEGINGLLPFLKKANFSVVAANLNLDETPELEGYLKKSTILGVRGVKVGVIGYLTPETKTQGLPNKIEYRAEIDAINEEATILKNEGVKIIIALGHSGYEMDKKIAALCPEVDIVIGAHTHSFLYTGEEPDIEVSQGPYPTIVKQENGKNVLVVQAYAFTKYLGKLHVKFDSDGDLIEFDGQPILLNASIPEDEKLLVLLARYRKKMTALEKGIIGHTQVLLQRDNKICHNQECNIGNLIADSMVFARVLEDKGGKYWTDAPIAFVGGGGIRASLPKGEITKIDVYSVLQHKNDLYLTQVTGKTLRKTLEHSASLRNGENNGGFLQMSGVHVFYNYENKPNQIVESINVRCSQCDVPIYEPLDDAKIYSVIITEFLKEGGDGHVFLEENGPEPILLENNIQEALVQYLEHHDFVFTGIEGRILINNGIIG